MLPDKRMMDGCPLDLLLPPSLSCCSALSDADERRRRLGNFNLSPFIHSSSLCIQEERLQHRLPGRRGAALLGEAAAVRLAGAAAAAAAAEERVRRRSPEVTRRRPRPPEAAQDHPRGRRRIEVGREEEFSRAPAGSRAHPFN